MANIGPLELGLMLIVFLIQAFPIIALVDAIRVANDSDFRTGTKLIWVLVILFLNCLGAVLYYALGKPSSVGSRL
jgi:hypothetical protein